jgi:hypothetical protein
LGRLPSFADTRANGEVAPIADVPVLVTTGGSTAELLLAPVPETAAYAPQAAVVAHSSPFEAELLRNSHFPLRQAVF